MTAQSSCPSRAAYNHHKCRCDGCRAANAAYQREKWSAGNPAVRRQSTINNRLAAACRRWMEANAPREFAELIAPIALSGGRRGHAARSWMREHHPDVVAELRAEIARRT